MMDKELENLVVDDLTISTLADDRQCAVCKQKPAVGSHYGVYCCHGCKSFFRRSTIDKREYPPCPQNETCYADENITTVIKKCKFCRLKTCFDVGMKPKLAAKQKRSARGNINQKTITNLDIQVTIRSPYLTSQMLLGNLAHVHNKIEKLKISTYNPIVFPVFKEMIEAPSKLHLADKLGMMMGWPLSQSEFIEKQSELLKMKTRLESENDYPDFTKFENINIKDWFPFDLLLIVENAKTFDFFNKLDCEDKLVLIRGTSIMALVLTSTYYSYNLKKEVIVKPDGIFIGGTNKNLVINSLIGSNVKITEFIRKWRDGQRILSMMIRDKLTISEFLLLRAMIVCNPALNLSTSAAKILQIEREKMSQALFNHCLTEHGKNGSIRFTILLNYIIVLSEHVYDFTDFLRLIQISSPGRTPDSRKRLLNEFFSLELN